MGLESSIAQLLADFQRDRAEAARRAEEQARGPAPGGAPCVANGRGASWACVNGPTQRPPPRLRQPCQVAAAGAEVGAMRRLLRLKTRELRLLRRLGQEVLLQRSEVEIFLVASLQQVGGA
jgi:hypothetical protein